MHRITFRLIVAVLTFVLGFASAFVWRNLLSNLNQSPARTNLSGGALDIKRDDWVQFALSNPEHVRDWQRVRDKLKAEGFECPDLDGSSLGGSSFSIIADRFGHAKEVVTEFISSNSLTVRVRKQKDSELFEVYIRGKKVKEESYIVK